MLIHFIAIYLASISSIFSSFEQLSRSPQINGVDMRLANHDQAVQLLTDTQRFVRIVIEREVKGPLEPPQSPRSPLLKGLSPTGYMANRPSKKKLF